MAYNQKMGTLAGFKANSTGLATSQFKIVKIASTANIVVLNGTAAFAGNFVGVLQNAPGPNEEALVAYDGISKLKVATSTIVAGDVIGCNTTSLGTDGSTTDNGSRIGKAITPSAAANDIITVCLIPGGWRY